VSSLGRVDVELMPDSSALATWMEIGAPTELRVRRVQPSGVRGQAVTVAQMSSGRPSGYPRIARSGSELVFAWTEVVPGKTGAAPTTRVLTSSGR